MYLYNTFISGISADSRLAKKNHAFFLCANNNIELYQRYSYILDSLKKGVALIVVDNQTPLDNFYTYCLDMLNTQNIDDKELIDELGGVTQGSLSISSIKNRISNKIVIVSNVFDALCDALNEIYPNAPRYCVGVTGTNGKSSVVDYYRQLMFLCGYNTASIGTLGVITNTHNMNNDNTNDSVLYDDVTSLTTLSLIDNQRVLHRLYNMDIQNIAMEVSSHGLSQKRVNNIKYDVVVITNITHDHLDYHGSFREYVRAKFKIILHHAKAHGVLVITHEFIEQYFTKAEKYLKDDEIILLHKNMSLFRKCIIINEKDYIIKSQNSLYYQEVLKTNNDSTTSILSFNILSSTIDGQKVQICYEDRFYTFKTGLIGKFQICNMLMSIASAVSNTEDLVNIQDITKYIPYIKCVPGRLERVSDNDLRISKDNIEKKIFVDYAHTPDALKTVLSELRKIIDAQNTSSKLILVFGCGGNRDLEKRGKMGKIASNIADIVVVTDDNPRFESPKDIRSNIMKYCNGINIEGRAKAIEYAIGIMKDGDILLVAGKGHETYQVINGTIYHFSDKYEILKVLDKC